MPFSGELLRRSPSQEWALDSFRQVFVDGDLGEKWAQHVGDRLQNDGHQRHHDVPFVGTQIPQQPPHQAAVIRFTYDLFFLVRCHSRVKTRAPKAKITLIRWNIGAEDGKGVPRDPLEGRQDWQAALRVDHHYVIAVTA